MEPLGEGRGIENALTCMVFIDFYIEGKYVFFLHFFKALNKKIHKLVCVWVCM